MNKTISTITALFLFFGFTNLLAQTALEKGMEEYGIDINLPSFLDASQNTERIYVAEISEENPVPEIAQQFGSKATVWRHLFQCVVRHGQFYSYIQEW